MRKIARAAALLLMAVFYYAAVRHCAEAQQQARTVTAVLEDGAMTAEEAEALCAKEAEQEAAEYICIWGEQPVVQLYCAQTGQRAEVRAVLTFGHPDVVIGGLPELSGRENGCFMDERTAEALFGTRQAAGQTVEADGCEYTVYGTFESLRRTIVRQAALADGAVLNAVSLWADEDDAAGRAGQLLLRHERRGTVTEFATWTTLAADSLLLLPFLWVLRLVSFLRSCGRSAAQENSASGKRIAAQENSTSGKRSAAFYFILAFAAAASGLYALWQRFQIPAGMLPTRWADFSFWGEWWSGQQQNLLRMFGGAPGEMQLMLLQNLLLLVLCNLAALLCAGAAYRNRR